MVKDSLFSILPQGSGDSAVGFRLRSACMTLVTLLLISVAGTANAQIVQLANESFKKSLPQGWSVYPASTPTAPTWASDTHVTASGKYAMHGYVPYNAGDTVELVTPFYDCTNYKHVQLKFKHICKVLGSDLCQIYYREDNLSSKWKLLPSDAYMGKSATYKKTLSFDDRSYSEWKSDDTTAIPDNSWWKEETFDVTNCVGFAKAAFKFVIKKGNNFGSFIADGWYLDDFQLTGSVYSVNPPTAYFIKLYDDVTSYQGPYEIQAVVNTNSEAPIVTPFYLHYTAIHADHSVDVDSLLMAKADSVWKATIPKQTYGTKLMFSLLVLDTLNNAAVISDSFKIEPASNNSIFEGGVALTSFVSPVKYVKKGSPQQVIRVRGYNKTPKYIAVNRFQLYWVINGVFGTRSVNRVSAYEGFEENVTVYTPGAVSDTITVWIKYPNGMNDTITYDDTVKIITYTVDSLPSGTYTVGHGGKYDFESLEHAVGRCAVGGMNGDVTFLLANGVYNENWDFSFWGNQTKYRIRIASLSGCADSVVICAKKDNVLTLASCNGLCFENLTFTADSAAKQVVRFTGDCKNISFRQCVFNGRKDVIGTDANYAIVYFNGTGVNSPNLFDSINFTSNRFLNGTLGIYGYRNTSRYLYYNASHIIIDSNLFEGFRHAVIKMPAFIKASSFSFNTMREGDTACATLMGGCFLSSKDIVIEGNHLSTKGNAATQYGIRVNNCDSTVRIVNNEIILKSMNGSAYGVHVTSSHGIPVLNNSVLIHGTANASQYGVYVTAGGTYFAKIRNNIASIDSKITASSYPLFIDTTSNIAAYDIDYNLWYSHSNMAGVAILEKMPQFNYYDKKTYSLSTQKDYWDYLRNTMNVFTISQHDVGFPPVFADTSYQHLYLREFRDMLCPRNGIAVSDMEGVARMPQTIMGCHANVPDSFNIALHALLGWPENSALSDTLRPAVVIMNTGNTPVTNADLAWEIDGVGYAPVHWTGRLTRFGEMDTVFLGNVNLTMGNHVLKVYISDKYPNALAFDDTLLGNNLTCVQSLNGSYTIGVSGDYKTLEDAFDVINACGVSGHVTLSFLSGTYYINTVVPYIAGLDSNHTLHITSLAENCDSVVLRRADSSNSNLTAAPLIIDGAEYVKVSHLTLNGMGANDTVVSCAHAMVIAGSSSNIEVSDCRMLLPQYLKGTGDYDALAGVFRQVQPKQNNVVKDNNCANFALAYLNGNGKYLELSRNTMEGGICAFHVEGKSDGNRLNNVEMSKNHILGVDYGACQAINVNNCLFSGNRVQQRLQNHSFKGFAVNTGRSTMRVEGNRFHYHALGTAIVGHMTTVHVINNEIKGGNTGIHLGKSANYYIYHNSIYTNTNAISFIQAVGMNPQQWVGQYSPGNIYCYNNILHVKNGKTISDDGVWKSLGYGAFTNRSNCYYNDATGTANLGANIAMGNNSISIRPVYVDTSMGLDVKNAISLKCDPINEVLCDINGVSRFTAVKTTMGAYENTKFCDAGLLGFAGVDSLTYIGKYPVGAIVQNTGLFPIDSAVIYLYLNNVQVAKTLYRPLSPLTAGNVDTVVLGSFPFNRDFNDLLAIIKVATDSIPTNDTIHWNAFVCGVPLSGNYTIGGNNADFSTIEEVKTVLHYCGISAPVVFRIQPGKYGALVWQEADIAGSSDTNTITFMPDNGLVVFCGGDSLPGLVLKNTTPVIFKGLTFGNLSDGLAGVQINGGCQSVCIRECNIYACSTATDGKYKALTCASKSFIIKNNIIGGCYNISLGENAAVVIDSNVLMDAFQYGIYGGVRPTIRSISHNRISSRYAAKSNNSVNYYGFYYHNYGTCELMDGNVMDVRCSGNGYGLYATYNLNYYGSKRGLLINNDIRVTGKGVKYGVYLQLDGSGSKADVHHNSVYVYSEDSNAYGFRLGGLNLSNSAKITRNLVKVKGKINSPVYFADAAYGYDASLREWNNWYADGQRIAYINGTSYSDISSMQQKTGTDAYSISVNPLFKDVSVNLELNKYALFNCPFIPDVAYDINGVPRGSVTSMGAYGYDRFERVNLEILDVITQKVEDAVCILPNVPVSAVVRNSGILSVGFDSSMLRINVEISGASNYRWDTVINKGSIVSGGLDTFRLINVKTIASGTYHIRVMLSDSADVNAEDDTLSTDYTVRWIEPPYDVNFTTVPAELISVSPSGSIGWKVVSGAGSTPAVAPAFGTGRLEFVGAGNPGASANAVFNGVNLKGCLNPTLSFWYAHDADDSKRDLMFVLATTDGGASYTEIGRITAAAAATGWKQYDIDLSRFANEPCLSIVFQAISFGGANQSLDRIRITADADAALTLLLVDFTAFTACENDAVPLKVVVSNITAMPVEYSSDTIRATVTGASNQGFTCVYSKSLVGYESDTITLGSMDLRSNGNYYINVSMQSQDDNAQNDTASDSTILIRQDIALDSIVGIDAQTQHPGGDTVYVSALLRNNCNMAVDRFTVTMELNGETVVTDTVLHHMEAGDSIIHAVSMPYVVPFGTKEQPYYFLELSASIPCDGDANNDSRSVVGVIAVPDTVDLQVLSISRPATDSGRVKVSPKVTVANIGNAEVQNVMLHVDVLDSAMTQLETVSEYINFINTNDTLEYAFSLTYTVPNYDGSYYLKAYADTYANEINTANDTLTAKFACKRNSTGIVSHTAADWSVGQNEPNPASATTTIPFVIPEDAEVALTIMGVNGQLLHREIVAATAGANRVTLHTGTLRSGLYYYGVEYKGQRIVRKMNVIR